MNITLTIGGMLETVLKRYAKATGKTPKQVLETCIQKSATFNHQTHTITFLGGPALPEEKLFPHGIPVR